ncbi:MAG: hypothetical protein AAF658_10845, partial [Myxococcota bacterium]
MRTFYRQPALRSENSRPPPGALAVGNFGDLFTAELIQHVYGLAPELVRNEGRRLLLNGSIAHKMRSADIVCGVGTKGQALPHPRELGEVQILG